MNSSRTSAAPLSWDFAAISTYGLVSLMFWYVGLIPDLATLRDRAQSPFRRWIYGLFALGWRGSGRHWHNYEMAYLLLAGLATPLVVSVHTIVSFDFATALLPGWHTTIFPPYFVTGAIFSGLAMVITLLVPLRKACGLEDLITITHLQNMCKLIVATSLIIAYAYGTELFMVWYAGNPFEQDTFRNRIFGPYSWCFATMILCNVLIPQLFWFRWFRTTPWAMFILSMFVNVGMWFERFVIVTTAQHHDFLPSSWKMFYPTSSDYIQLAGGFGLFTTLFLIFIRFLPMVAISEVKACLPAADPHAAGHGEPAPVAADSSRAAVASNPSLDRASACWPGSPGRPSCWPPPKLCTWPDIAAWIPTRPSRSMEWSGPPAPPVACSRVRLRRWSDWRGLRPVGPELPEYCGLPADHRW